MRQAYITAGVDESVVVKQALSRDEKTFIHHHDYLDVCNGERTRCHVVNGKNNGTH